MKVVSRGVCVILSAGMVFAIGCSKSPQPSSAASQPAAAPAPKVVFHPDPDGPENNKPVKLYVSLQDVKGNAVTDAAVKVTLKTDAMPSMNMPEMKKDVVMTRSGPEFVATTALPMAGLWGVSVEVTHEGKTVATYQDTISVQR